MTKTKKIILLVVSILTINISIVLLTIHHAKTEIKQHTEYPLKFSGLSVTKDFKLGINFKEERFVSLWEYIYTLPDGAVYTRHNGSHLLILSEEKL